MSIQIVPMNADHLEELEKLERLCFSRPWSEQSLSASLHNGRSVFLTAHGAAGLLGYLGMEYVLGEGSVTNVAVYPPYRRQGVAHAPLARLLQTAPAMGPQTVTPDTRAGDAAIFFSLSRKSALRSGLSCTSVT